MAALGAPALDECPARAITHAATEPVFPLTSAIIWLIGTLHGEVIPSRGSRGASVHPTERAYSRDLVAKPTQPLASAKTTTCPRNTQ